MNLFASTGADKAVVTNAGNGASPDLSNMLNGASALSNLTMENVGNGFLKALSPFFSR